MIVTVVHKSNLNNKTEGCEWDTLILVRCHPDGKELKYRTYWPMICSQGSYSHYKSCSWYKPWLPSRRSQISWRNQPWLCHYCLCYHHGLFQSWQPHCWVVVAVAVVDCPPSYFVYVLVRGVGRIQYLYHVCPSCCSKSYYSIGMAPPMIRKFPQYRRYLVYDDVI